MKALKLAGIFLGLAFLVITAGTADAAGPVGTDFTYQGQLTLSGIPVNNTCDSQFSLFDATTVGAQVGTTLSKSNIGVTNGLFTASLDFGVSAFNGQARFLEISVRCPAGTGSYTTLSPRQALTATPYALHAASVADDSVTSAKIADGTIVNADLAPGAYTNITGVGTLGSLAVSGNVGIGTTSPASKLQVMGDALFGDRLTVTSSGQFGTNSPVAGAVSSRTIDVNTSYTANTAIKIAGSGGGYLVTFNLDTSGSGGASGIFAVYCDPRYSPICSSSQLVFLKEAAESAPSFSFTGGEIYMSFPNSYGVGVIRVLRLN